MSRWPHVSLLQRMCRAVDRCQNTRCGSRFDLSPSALVATRGRYDSDSLHSYSAAWTGSKGLGLQGQGVELFDQGRDGVDDSIEVDPTSAAVGEGGAIGEAVHLLPATAALQPPDGRLRREDADFVLVSRGQWLPGQL